LLVWLQQVVARQLLVLVLEVLLLLLAVLVAVEQEHQELQLQAQAWDLPEEVLKVALLGLQLLHVAVPSLLHHPLLVRDHLSLAG
jgi:uncharacterized integral membrane protein